MEPSFDPAAMDSAMGAAMAAVYASSAIGLLLAIILIASMWKLFTKAGQPGWAAIVPIYNIVVLMQIINRPTWWVLLMLIPFVNIVVAILVTFDLAKAFGKSTGFGLGLLILSVIFYPMLAFGDSQHTPITREA